MTKAEIRVQMAERKKTFPPGHLKTWSAAVTANIKTMDAFRTARTVGAYMPLADEADITPLLHESKKTFYIPAFDETSGIYRMARLTANLKKGRFGILEPAIPVFAGENEMDLILVPGVAFDRTGRRLGRGAGFYDRLLPRYRTWRAGICFDFQILDRIPDEPHDCLMNGLVSETFILNPG